MDITDLTSPEQRVLEAFPRGAVVDFRPAEERTVRAEVLRALLLGGAHEDGQIAALRLIGARITGTLNLRYADIQQYAVLLAGCRFDDIPLLYGAHVRQLNLSESVLPGLTAATIRVDGVLRLTDCRFSGPVQLGGAAISGAVFLDRATLGGDGTDDGTDDGADDGADDRAEAAEPVLQLNQATIDDDLVGTGLVARGEVRLDGVTVAGSVDLKNARLSNPGGTALQAETMTVGADVHARGLEARGRVNIRGARVPGQLGFIFTRLSNPGGTALRASSCAVGELWLREAAPIEGEVNLRRSRLDLLHAASGVWPETVRLDGLTYSTLAPREPAERRLPLLARDADGYVPSAYEQLAAAYRRIGDDAAARTVQLARQRRHRAMLPWYARLWGWLQDGTVGYGFRPVRAVGWLLSLLLVGSLTYGLQPPAALKPSEAPAFNPFFYSLDLLLPIIDLGQERAYAPDGWHQSLSYVLVITGWILATTVAAGVTRTVSRQ